MLFFSDYGVVLNGEFQLELTDGSFTTLRTVTGEVRRPARDPTRVAQQGHRVGS